MAKKKKKEKELICAVDNPMSEFVYYLYTQCTRRNVRDFERVFLMLNYTDITQNTYIQS